MSGSILRPDVEHSPTPYDDLLAHIKSVTNLAAAEATAWDAYDADRRIFSTEVTWRDAERRLTAAKGRVLSMLEDLTGADWGAR
jgi:hypothetical protein